MAGTHHKKQQITAALAGVRIQLQNELLLLRHNLNVGHHILESIRNHPWEWMSSAAIFGWLLSRVPARKKDLHLQLKSRAGQKPWQGAASQTLERVLEHLQTSDRRIPREKTGGESEDARKQVALNGSV
jgi:hypothetical protein